jgi:hypothetical protein
MDIDLKDYYPADSFKSINAFLYESALKGTLRAYENDSLKRILTAQEIINSGNQSIAIQAIDPKNPDLIIDSVVNIPYDPKQTTFIRLYYDLVYDQAKGTIQLVFKAYSPCLRKDIEDPPFPAPELFVSTTTDIIAVFGKKAASELFLNCYNGLVRNIHNTGKKPLPNTTSFHLQISEFIGQAILDDFNSKLFESITKPPYSIKPYRSDSLTDTYSFEEVMDRGSLLMTIQELDPMDPSGEILIETVINEPFNSAGQKFYSLSFNWKYDPVKMIAYPTIRAFGICLFNEKENKTSLKTLFWFDWKLAGNVFAPAEISLLKYSFYYALGYYRYCSVSNLIK